MHKIVRKIPRPDPEAVKILGELGVATVHEAQGRTGLMKPYMRPIYPSAKAAGPAVTVLCQSGDNLMIHAAVEVCQPGDVLVVDYGFGFHRRHVRRLAGDLADGARRPRA